MLHLISRDNDAPRLDAGNYPSPTTLSKRDGVAVVSIDERLTRTCLYANLGAGKDANIQDVITNSQLRLNDLRDRRDIMVW
jgi:hypothetical protein